MRKILLGSMTVLTLSVFTASAQTTIALQKGQKYASETTVKVTSSAEVMGQTMESGSDSKSATVYEITETKDGGAKLISTVTKLQVTASAMGQEMSYDSEKNDNSGQLAEALEGSINKPRKMVIDAKGNVTEQEEENEGMKAAVMGMGAASSASKVTDLFIPALMGKELKAGDKFEDAGTSKGEKLESKETGTYTITAVENGVASVSYAGTQQISATMEQMGMEMNTTSTNTIKSELQVDVKTGLVLAKATVIDAVINVEAAGMSIPATGKTIITTKISQSN